WLDSPLPSACRTLYLPCRVGMRLSMSGTHCRLSSNVDQSTCRRAEAFAATAIAFASAISFSGEQCAQKKVTQKAAQAPSNALFRLSGLSMSALTTSAPSLAKPFALALFTSLVSTRAAKVRFGSLRIARTKPPPCAPVAPTTAITFLLLIATFFLPHRRLHRGYV